MPMQKPTLKARIVERMSIEVLKMLDSMFSILHTESETTAVLSDQIE